MIDCQQVMKRLWEYLDGELPAADVPVLRGHLTECARCNPQYRFQLAFLAVVAKAGAATTPRPAFVQRLRSVLASADR